MIEFDGGKELLEELLKRVETSEELKALAKMVIDKCNSFRNDFSYSH